MKVTPRGEPSVTLTDNNFVAAGGQGSVYVKNGVAYKIYANPVNSIPEAKFRVLQDISDDHVIKPERMLLNSNNTPIGYTMRAVSSKNTLGHLFTKPFIDRNKITQDNKVNPTAKIRERVPHIHAAKALIVDFNEVNLLVPDTWEDIYFIDVDSYSVAGYPATFLKPSIRDYTVTSSAGWSELSDWYSFAIITFQLFVGSHPYRGGHTETDASSATDGISHEEEPFSLWA